MRSEVKKQIRVVIFGNLLHMAGIAASLQTAVSIEVLCLDPRTEADRNRLEKTYPAAVVFDLSDPSSRVDIAILQKRPGLLLIGIDPCSDELLVLSCRSPKAFSITDLVDIICQNQVNLENDPMENQT
jgi:hypothetical protein